MILDYLVLPLWTVLGTRYSCTFVHPHSVHRDFFAILIRPQKKTSLYSILHSLHDLPLLEPRSRSVDP